MGWRHATPRFFGSRKCSKLDSCTSYIFLWIIMSIVTLQKPHVPQQWEHCSPPLASSMSSLVVLTSSCRSLQTPTLFSKHVYHPSSTHPCTISLHSPLPSEPLFLSIPSWVMLTLSVPVSYQQPTSPYIIHTKYVIWWWENENWSNKANYWRLKVKFSQICSMKSMGSGWENLKYN